MIKKEQKEKFLEEYKKLCKKYYLIIDADIEEEFGDIFSYTKIEEIHTEEDLEEHIKELENEQN